MLTHETDKKSFVNDKLIGRTLEVTKKDIIFGVAKAPNSCPISRAAKRELKTDILSVGYSGMGFKYRIDHGDGDDDYEVMQLQGILSKDVTKWIKNFDADFDADPIILEFNPPNPDLDYSGDFVLDVLK